MAKDAYWFPHDANARHDPKLIKLRMRHGLAGIGFFWCCIEFLRDQENYRATREDFEMLEFELNEKTIFNSIVEFGLIVTSDGFLYSKSLVSRMSMWDSRRKAGSRGGKNSVKTRKEKSALKQNSSKIDFASKQSSSKAQVITEQNRTEQDRINRTGQDRTDVTGHLAVAVARKVSEKSKSGETWEAYRSAYMLRYGVEPLRNKTVNSVLCRLVDSIGAENAPKVAKYYLADNNHWYMTKGHHVQSLLNDAQKLLTELTTGHRVSTHQAREADRLQGVGDVWQRVIADKCEKE